MKLYCTYFLLSVLTLNTWARIKNGYAAQIEDVKMSLHALYSLLYVGPESEPSNRRILKAKIRKLEQYVVMHELTENILSQFKKISPELYDEIDNLFDRKGRMTDVFVKIISPEEARLSAVGTTNVESMPGDADAYRSEFGPHSVSIRIWNVNKALWVLAHEFGHAKYQVRNLAKYLDFYRNAYGCHAGTLTYIGHHLRDLSGQSAHATEGEFRKRYNLYIKNASLPIEFPSAFVERTRRKMQADKRGYFMTADLQRPREE